MFKNYNLHGNKEQTDSNQKGEGRRVVEEKRGRVIKEHVKRTHGQRQSGERWQVGGGGGWGEGKWWWENGDNCI